MKRIPPAAALLCLALLSGIAGEAHAQDCPNDARTGACRAHLGCSFVLLSRGSCERAKAFLDRFDKLRGARDIVNNDVFDAASPPVTDPGVAKYAQAARKAVVDSPLRGKLDTRSGKGDLSYYEGGLDGSRMQGAGVFINEDGAMARGQFSAGQPDGVVHYVLPDGSMRAGIFKGSAPQGRLARQAGPGAARAAPPPAADEARTDDLVELQLISRWREQGDSAVLLISLASYHGAQARRTGCASGYEASRCSIQAIYRYDSGGFVNPWRPATVPYAGKQEPSPACKYTPRRYSPVPIRLRPAEDTCRDLLMLAIHESMPLGVTGNEALTAWAGAAAVPGTSSGQCKADLEALDKGVEAIRARRPNYAPGTGGVQNAQFAMFVQGNRYRVLQGSCRGRPEAGRIPAMRRLAGDIYIGCAQAAGDPSRCVARVPW